MIIRTLLQRLLVLVAAVVLSSCATHSSRVSPDIDINQYKTFFVLRHAVDTRLVDEIIRDEMVYLGFKTQSGTIGQKPPNIDVVVTYEDRWYWDMTMYMISLTINFHDARSNELLATGYSFRPSLVRKSPKGMVQEVLEGIIGKNKTPIPPRSTAFATAGTSKSIDELVGSDGRFEKYTSGVVRDTRTGLEWLAGPDHDTGYVDALRWINGLKVDGGGWRMPIEREVTTLYQRGAGKRNMTPLLKTTGWYVWTQEAKSSGYAWNFRYNAARTNSMYTNHQYIYHARGFAVRHLKK